MVVDFDSLMPPLLQQAGESRVRNRVTELTMGQCLKL